MHILSQVEYLLDYTDWERDQWQSWFRTQGPGALAIGLGANADGRIANVGELVRHIFSAEQRYVERIQELPVSDTGGVPANNVDTLFDFGRHTRANMRTLLRDFPAGSWDRPRDVQFGQNKRALVPRTMLVQSLTHEIRHWAHIAMLMRMDGRKPGMHDFLVSGVFERKLGGVA